jgi:Arc/MetJ family transcription regulator
VARTEIDVDDDACRAVMWRYRLPSKDDAVNLALRHLAAGPLDIDAARRVRGSEWDGNIDERRAGRT